ncbi:MAG: hypothetical protein E7511_02845 [Ruminococcus sp.]|nr:hypothetical protein [Ruminococcus sp.]
MNRNELEQMLTLVDEKYIAELGESEETTSDVTVQKPAIRRFIPFAAAAAAVCLCVAGVGLAQQGGLRTGTSVQEPAYQLVWDTGELVYVDAEESEVSHLTPQSIDPPLLPFDEGEKWYTEEYSSMFLNENGLPVRVFIERKNEEKSLKITMDDTRHPSVYPVGKLHCETLEAEYGCPVILGIDLTTNENVPAYRFCFVRNGTGFVIRTSGFTIEEAERMAASLLNSDVTAAGLCGYDAPASTPYTIVRGDTTNVEVVDYKFTAGGETLTYQNPVLPIYNFPYASSDMTVYLNVGGGVSSACVGLYEEGKQFLCRINDKGTLYPTYFAEDVAARNIAAESLTDAVVLYVYDASFIDDTEHYPGWEDKAHYQVYCMTNGIGYSIDAFGCTEQEAVDFAWELCGVSGIQLYADNKDAGDDSLYFQREESMPLSPAFDPQSLTSDIVTESRFDLAFDTVPFTGNDCIFYLDSTGRTLSADMKLYNDAGQWARILISAVPGMFTEGQLEEPGSVERDSVRLYGCHPQENYAELCFGIENVDCFIQTFGLSEKEAVNLADNLIVSIRYELERKHCPFGDLHDSRLLLGSAAYVPQLLQPDAEMTRTLADAFASVSWREFERDGQYPDGQCEMVFVYNGGSPFRLTFYSDLTVDMEHDGSVVSYIIEEDTAHRAVREALQTDQAATMLVDCEMENLTPEGVWIGRE